MRVSGLWCAAAWVACLLPITAAAQSMAQRRAAAIAASEEQTEPYHKHRDTRHGHDHYYPDRGAIVRDLPVGTIGTSYAGVSYRYHDGIWLEPRGPAYMVVAPPVGLIAPTLPLYSTVVAHGSDSFLYCNDTYYRPRPDLGGYEVVNDPAMEAGPAAPAEPEALVGGRMPSTPVAGSAVPAAGATVPGAGTTAPGAPAFGAGAAGAVGATALVGGAAAGGAAAGGAAAGGSTAGAAAPVSTGSAGSIGAPLGTASVGPPAGGTVVPVSAREAALREASLSGGAMPGANIGTARLGGDTSAAMAATPGATSAGVTTQSSGAAAAAVPAASLGTSAGLSAPAAPAAGTQKVPKVFLYPRNGQSADQQARDRYDCYRFAVAQSGFDPLRTSGSAPAPAPEQQSDFDRAQGACFEGRGYSNR